MERSRKIGEFRDIIRKGRGVTLLDPEECCGIKSTWRPLK